ncbi:MAG: hypothetical protein ACN4GZ_16690 [Acidimicrobiales bacterium]
MSARSRSGTWARCVGVIAGLVAVVITGCTSPPNPGTLARTEEPDAVSSTTIETLPPVTTAPAPTTTTTAAPTTFGPPSSEVESSTTTEEPPAPRLQAISEQLGSVLGPTDDLALAIGSVVPIPPGLMTPDDADIVEVSIGVGSLADDDTVLAQIAISMTTTLDDATAFNRMAAALQAAGMFTVDATSVGETRSASFRVPGVELFDEVVVTTSPNGDGASMRITWNSTRKTDQFEVFVDWAEGPLPLPGGDRQTLVVVGAAGSDRLRFVDLMVESTSVVESRSPQREANRLISLVEDSDLFGYDGNPDIDQPLSGQLSFEGLDSLGYSVAPATRVEVDSDGEPEEVEVVVVRLRGVTRLDG